MSYCGIGYSVTQFESSGNGGMRQLGPHNQRRLNAILRKTDAGHEDWYDLATSMQRDGATLAQIATRFGELGVGVTIWTVRKWLIRRREQSAA
jgi:hypothetical protein